MIAHLCAGVLSELAKTDTLSAKAQKEIVH